MLRMGRYEDVSASIPSAEHHGQDMVETNPSSYGYSRVCHSHKPQLLLV